MFFLFVLAGWIAVGIAATVLMQRFIGAGRGELSSGAERHDSFGRRTGNGSKIASETSAREEGRRAA